MKKLICCAVFTLIVVNPVFAIEPNDPLNVNNDSAEDRIRKLEDKIIELEDRIAELESQRPALPAQRPGLNSPAMNDPNKDTSRIEQCSKSVQESQNLIALYETQLNNLPTCYHLPLLVESELKNLPHYYQFRYYYSTIHQRFISLDMELNWALDNLEILSNIEAEYKIIERNAQRTPELNINRNDISKRLIELRSEWVGFDKLRDDLRNSMGKGYRFLRSKCYESINKRPIRSR